MKRLSLQWRITLMTVLLIGITCVAMNLLLRTLRQTDRETRVLILSARSEVEDKVEGLDAGANDYLAKPFHLAELRRVSAA